MSKVAPRQLPPVVINAIELFVRHYPYDPMASDEWKHYVLPEDLHVFFRVKQRVEGRKWHLQIFRGEKRCLLDVENLLDYEETRRTHAYDADDKLLVGSLLTIQTGWPEPPARISGPLA